MKQPRSEILVLEVSGFIANEQFRASLTKSIVAGLVLAVCPHNCYAYVDPGIISVLVQTIFSIIAGIVAVWILAPWQAIKSLCRRDRRR